MTYFCLRKGGVLVESGAETLELVVHLIHFYLFALCFFLYISQTAQHKRICLSIQSIPVKSQQRGR